MQIACSTACFRALPLQDALDRIAECGYESVQVAAQDGSQVTPAGIRDDYETQHLLIGFGCAKAGLRLASLWVSLPDQSLEEELRTISASCTLAHALGVGAISVLPGRGAGNPETELEGLPAWVSLARDRETRLRVSTDCHGPRAELLMGRYRDLEVSLCLDVDALGLARGHGIDTAPLVSCASEIRLTRFGAEGYAYPPREMADADLGLLRELGSQRPDLLAVVHLASPDQSAKRSDAVAALRRELEQRGAG